MILGSRAPFRSGSRGRSTTPAPRTACQPASPRGAPPGQPPPRATPSRATRVTAGQFYKCCNCLRQLVQLVTLCVLKSPDIKCSPPSRRCTGASLSITNEVSEKSTDCSNPGVAGVPELVPQGTYLPDRAHCRKYVISCIHSRENDHSRCKS